MKAAVSTLAVATLIALGTSADAQRSRAPAPSKPASAATAAEADAFVAQAEKELAEFSIVNSRAQWVNSTYITDDTDALAAHFGTIGTEMSVRLANEAARFNTVRGLSYNTKRKLDILRGGIVLPAPTAPGVVGAGRTMPPRRMSSLRLVS